MDETERTMHPQNRVNLEEDEIPTQYYNIQADLREPLPPPLDPKTKQPVNPATLERIFAKELIRQEISSERYITIPDEVLRASLEIGRPSPSEDTNFGRSVQAQDKNHPGTLGIAISEALEDTVTHENTRYCLGSVMNHVLTHQSIIGLEAKKQFDSIDVRPDVIAGCIGGGSNFAGFAYPFLGDKLQGKLDADFVACEPKAVPSTTRGTFTYDFGDAAEMTPLLKMYTLGHKFQSPPIHSGGLRYHGKAPSLSYLINKGHVRSVAYHQNEVFQAARTFAQTEGVIPAPETAHCIKYIIDQAIQCKKTGEEKVLAFNNSGHGLLDLKAYEDFLEGKLTDYEPSKIEVETYVK